MSDGEVWFTFESSALDPDIFQVVRFTGEEAISRPFRFEIELVSARADIDLAAPLGRMASFGLRQEGGKGERKIHGVVSAFEQRCSALEEESHLYRAVLVPRLWQLSLGQGCRLHQDLSYPEIVERELLAEAERGPVSVSAADLAAEDIEIALSGSYPQRAYATQYDESDLDFITRLMEQEGLYFVFEQGEAKERLVIVDSNDRLPLAKQALKLVFRAPYAEIAIAEESDGEASEEEKDGEADESANGSADDDEGETARRPQVGVWSFASARRQPSHRLVLKDGGESALRAESSIDERGRGVVALHDETFTEVGEGERLARLRAEELICASAGHSGESNAIQISAGCSLALSGHPRRELDRAFLVTAVKHEGWQSRPGVPQSEEEAESFLGYINAFTAIPADLPYRPARTTPKPRIGGTIVARIDDAAPGRLAEIDAQGRCKLVLPFDAAGAEGDRATRWVPLAQPYAGAQQGLSTPLLKGSAVIVAFLDGDPDRPIVVGALPSADDLSAGKDTQSGTRIVSIGGVAMDWQDGSARGES